MNRKQSVLVLLAAVFVAAAIGSVQFALEVPIGPSPSGSDEPPASPRRHADPAHLGPVTVPLLRLSRVHVGIEVHAVAARPDAKAEHARATVVLDTGSSVALVTVDGQERFGLHVGAQPPLASRGFSGHPSKLFGLDDGQSLELSLRDPAEPSRVSFLVRYLSPNRLHGAHVIAPAQVVAPRGGAVRLDFAHDRFVACESVAQCAAGVPGLVPAATRPCADRPELVVVEVRLGDSAETMLLDTGAATLVFDDAFERAGFGRYVTESRAGRLLGAGSASVEARVVVGDFPWHLGMGGRIARTPESFWVVPPPDERPARCATAGSIGTDALGGCQVVIADGDEQRALLSCGPTGDAGR